MMNCAEPNHRKWMHASANTARRLSGIMRRRTPISVRWTRSTAGQANSIQRVPNGQQSLFEVDGIRPPLGGSILRCEWFLAGLCKFGKLVIEARCVLAEGRVAAI